jgi:hypothetical protein
MSQSERHAAAMQTPCLRVYYGEENDSPKGAGELDPDGLPSDASEEVDAVWAGRMPAARLSARIAA